MTTFLILAAALAALVLALLVLPASFYKSIGERVSDALFGYMTRSGLALTAFSAEDFQRYRVTDRNQSEVTRQRLYDYQLYPTAGLQQANFFAEPIGQGVTTALGAAVGTRKTLYDTNMRQANTLSSGMEYIIESIEVMFWPGSVNTANTYTRKAISNAAAASAATVMGDYLDDVNTFYQSGLLTLQILQKDYLQETPLIAFPPKAYFDPFAATSSTSATQNQTAMSLNRAAGRAYYLEPPISLQSTVNFGVVITWPALVATPSGFNGRFGVVLDGAQLRAAQ